MEPDDLVLWIEGLARARRRRHPHRPRQGLRVPADWANKGVPPALILETLRPLLELPVAFVLPHTAHRPAERTSSGHSPSAAQRTSCATGTRRRS
jgi:hypothetical protein